MIFTSKSRNNTATPLERPALYNMMLNNTTSSKILTQPKNTINQIKPSDRERMTWGAPTWTLFHMIPEKVTHANFIKYKDSVIRVIVTICNNLPCPSCSQHASEYMKKVNFSSIRTSEDLKKMLFNFHNLVNQRKGYAQYSYDDMIKYVDLDSTTVINEFMSHFQKKIYAPNLMAQQIYRQKQVEVVQTWFRENLHIFQ